MWSCAGQSLEVTCGDSLPVHACDQASVGVESAVLKAVWLLFFIGNA